MRFLEVPALITEDIEDPNIVDITEPITASISGTTLTIDGGDKVSGEVTITLTNDVTVSTVTTSNIKQPSIHKIIIKTNGAGNFTYVPNDGVTASSVSTTTKTGSDLDILLITTSGGDTYLDLDLADYVSPAANFSNVLTGFNITDLTSAYGTTAKLYKPDGTLLTTVNSAATGSGIGFGSGVESSPGDVIYKLEVTDDAGRKSKYNLPRKWINYAMETTSTPGFEKLALAGNEYTSTVTVPNLSSTSKARIHKTTDHGYMGIKFRIQGRNSPSDDWVDVDDTGENENADESAEFLAFGNYTYQRVWVKPTAKATTTVSSSNVVTLTLSNVTEDVTTKTITGTDPFEIDETSNVFVFEETAKIGTIPYTVTVGTETYTNAVTATTEEVGTVPNTDFSTSNAIFTYGTSGGNQAAMIFGSDDAKYLCVYNPADGEQMFVYKGDPTTGSYALYGGTGGNGVYQHADYVADATPLEGSAMSWDGKYMLLKKYYRGDLTIFKNNESTSTYDQLIANHTATESTTASWGASAFIPNSYDFVMTRHAYANYGFRVVYFENSGDTWTEKWTWENPNSGGLTHSNNDTKWGRFGFQFSKDKKYAALTSYANPVSVAVLKVDLENTTTQNKFVKIWEEGITQGYACAMSPDGKYIIAGNQKIFKNNDAGDWTTKTEVQSEFTNNTIFTDYCIFLGDKYVASGNTSSKHLFEFYPKKEITLTYNGKDMLTLAHKGGLTTTSVKLYKDDVLYHAFGASETSVVIAEAGVYQAIADDKYYSLKVTVTTVTETQAELYLSHRTCFLLKKDGKVWYWGESGNGVNATGNNTTVNVATLNDNLNALPSGIKQIGRAAVDAHCRCAITNDGKLYTWGYNGHGGLGRGNTTSYVSQGPWLVSTQSSNTFTFCHSSYYSNFALQDNGYLWSCGYNSQYVLGTGNNSQQNTFYRINLPNVIDFNANHDIALALTSDSEVYIWGTEGNSSMGGASGTTGTPTHMTALDGKNIVKVRTAYQTGHAISSDGKLYSWGRNNNSQIPKGSNGNVTTPTEMTWFSRKNIKVVDVAPGHDATAHLALDDQGNMYIWGINSSGSTGVYHHHPTTHSWPVLLKTNIASISCGYNECGCIDKFGQVYTWGDAAQGQQNWIHGSNSDTDINYPTSNNLSVGSSVVYDGFDKYLLGKDTTVTSNVTFGSNTVSLGTKSEVFISDPHTYKFKIMESGKTTYTSNVISSTLTRPTGRVYPPKSGTHKSLTTSGSANVDNTWTTDGALYGNGAYKASMDKNTNSSEHVYHAFSGVTGYGHMHTNNLGSTATAAIQLHMPQKIKLTKYAMYSRNFTGEYNYAPRDWKVYGSNDKTNWTELDSQTNETVTAWGSQLDHRDTKREYTVSGNTKYFSSYKLDVTANGGGSFVVISQIEYYGDEEGFLSDDGFGKLTLDVKGDTSATSNIVFHSNTYVMGAARDLYITDTGEYTADIYGSNKHFLGSKTHTISTVDAVPGFTAAFHHGAFSASDYSSAYSSVSAAATAGFVYSDTPAGTYTWGTLAHVKERENPDFTANSTLHTDYSSTYGWTTNSGWEVSAKDEFSSTYPVWKAFNKNDGGDAWLSGSAPSTSSPQWIKIKYPSVQVIKSYVIKCRDNSSPRFPTAWKLQGANTDISDVAHGAGTGAQTITITGGGWQSISDFRLDHTQNSTYSRFYEKYDSGSVGSVNRGFEIRWHHDSGYNKIYVNTDNNTSDPSKVKVKPSGGSYGGIGESKEVNAGDEVSLTNSDGSSVYAVLNITSAHLFSLDETGWTDIGTEQTVSLWSVASEKSFDVSSNTTAYQYYRLRITGSRESASLSNSDYVAIGEWFLNTVNGDNTTNHDQYTRYTYTPASSITANVLRVAGGGGGGSTRGAGGGAGGLLYSENVSLSGTKSISVANGGRGCKIGGSGNQSSIQQGFDTTFSGLTTSVGGGRGAFSDPGRAGSGGSGGGGGPAFPTAGTGVSGQGYAGGNGNAGDNYNGGGGGGAGGVGATGSGVGGVGLDYSSVFGTTYGVSGWFAGGGGGGQQSGGLAGGQGGGGTYGTNSGHGVNHTGGGGGGSGTSVAAGSGGSGIVIIKKLGATNPPALNFDGYNKLSIDNVSFSANEWPPVGGTTGSVSYSNSNRDAEWTISGASYGNGTYKSIGNKSVLNNQTQFSTYRLFDKSITTNPSDNSSTSFHSSSASDVSGSYQVELPEAIVLGSYSLIHRGGQSTADIGHQPKDWTIEASNDGTTWTIIDTRIGVGVEGMVGANEGGTIAQLTRTFTLSGNTNSYKYYKLNQTDNNRNNPSSSYLIMGEWKLFEPLPDNTSTIKKDGAAFATTTSNTVYIRDTGTYTAEVKGSGAYVTEVSKVVSTLATKPDYTNIWAGQRGGMVVDSDGKLYTWGDNGNNQSGRGAQDRTPTHISTISDPVSNVWVEGTPGRTRIVKTSTDKWYMWGMNHTGSASMNKIFGETAEQSTPVDVTSYFTTHFGTQGTSDTTRIVKVVMSSGACSALAADGKVWSWGHDNNNNELGKNTTNGTASTPFKNTTDGTAELSNITDIRSLHYGKLALDSNGDVWQWGRLRTGSTGYATKQTVSNSYANISLSSGFYYPTYEYRVDPNTVQSSGYVIYTLYHLASSTFSSSGHNIKVQLSNNTWLDANSGTHPDTVTDNGTTVSGTRSDSDKQHQNPLFVFTKPSNVITDSVNIIGIGSGFFTAYAWDAAGTIYSIGQGSEGQLGIGANVDQDSTWQTVTTLQGKTIYGIYGAGYSVFAHTSDGVYACGQGADGRLGMGNNNNLNVFTKSTTLSALSIYKLDFGNGPGYIITTDGKGHALGDDTNSSIPTPLSGDKNVPTEASSLTNLSLVYQPPAITYDGKNKLTVGGTNYADTSTVTYYSNTYNLGTAKTMYVKDVGDYVFKISGTDKYVESNVHVSSVDLAGATTKPIDFDGYNKLTLISPGANAVSNVTYFSNTYDMGSASTFYIKDTGTYDLKMSGSNVFALSNTVVGTFSTPIGTYSTISNIDGTGTKLGASHSGHPISFNAAGTRVVIGEYNTHKAHVYDKVGASWTLSQTWTKSNGFGKSCAMSDDGNVVVVVENSGTNKLSLFVYENGSWVTKQNQISISGSRDTFGSGLFMSGDGLYLLVTDYSYEGSGGKGRNKIFDISEYSFLERHNHGFSNNASSWYGDIDRYGNRAIYDDGHSDYWHVYKRSGSSWSQSTTIAPSNTSGKGPASCDENMVRVALSDISNSNAGVTIWYRDPSGDTFALEQTITVDNSGCNISMNYAGDRLMITDKTAGDIEIWTRSGTTWTKQKTINPPTFGTLVNLAHTANKGDGYTLATVDETYDSNKGRVYIYSDPPSSPSLTFDNYNKLTVSNFDSTGKEWPPASFTSPTFSSSTITGVTTTNNGKDQTWTISGAAYGNGVYSASFDGTIHNNANYHGPVRCFDKVNDGFAFHSSSVPTGIVTLNMPENIILDSYELRHRPNANTSENYAPRDWTLEGSNDGTTWVVLDTQSNQSYNPDVQGDEVSKRTYTVSNNSTSYSRYRLNITANDGGVHLVIGQWKLFASNPRTATLTDPNGSTYALGQTQDTIYIRDTGDYTLDVTNNDQKAIVLKNVTGTLSTPPLGTNGYTFSDFQTEQRGESHDNVITFEKTDECTSTVGYWNTSDLHAHSGHTCIKWDSSVTYDAANNYGWSLVAGGCQSGVTLTISSGQMKYHVPSPWNHYFDFDSGRIAIPSPSLNFDTYNKLTVANVDSDATSNIDFFSNTYEMGSRKELIINDAGTYHANIYSSNTLALVKNYVNHLFPTTETQKIIESDRTNTYTGGTDDWFGIAVSISGDYAIVGSPYGDEDASNGNTLTSAGAAYIFKHNGTSWVEQQKIVPNVRESGFRFGWSVSISGDYVIVGTASTDGADAGEAYIFKRSGTTWTQEYKLVASDASGDDQFGTSVSISGDYAIVGASYEDLSGSDGAGAAYIFKRSGVTWTEETKVVASDRAGGDKFGKSVSISGDYAIVGSHNEDHDVTGGNVLSNAGSAYIFKRSAATSTWTQETKIVASDRAGGDNFGWSVSISGDYAIVGSVYEDHDVTGGNVLSNAGSAYVFKRSGTTWTQETKIVASDRAGSDYFGASVSISGDYAIVGSHYEDHDFSGANYMSAAGSAYIFKRSGTTWTQTSKISASDRGGSDYFGYSVSISGNRSIVGAYGHDYDLNGANFVSQTGACYLFERPAIGPKTFPGLFGFPLTSSIPSASNYSDVSTITQGAHCEINSGSLKATNSAQSANDRTLYFHTAADYDEFTVTFDFNLSEVGSEDGVFFSAEDTASNMRVELQKYGANTIRPQIQSTLNPTFTQTSGFSDWAKLTFMAFNKTSSRPGRVKIYIDDVLKLNQEATTWTTSDLKFKYFILLGGRPDGRWALPNARMKNFKFYNHTTLYETGPILTFDGYNKLTAPVLEATFTATRLSDWDNNNQSKSPNSGKGDWPGTSFTGESDAHWWTLHNNDKVYTSSYNYGTTRDAAQLFTTVTSSDWNHGYHTQSGWNATKILKLGYKFTVGSKTLGSMKLWQAPASYPTGDVTIKYWDGTSLKTVTNQSPSGFPSSISYYTEQEFTFNSANAQYWLIECKTHPSSPSTNYIGLAGWQLLSGRDPVSTVLTKGSDSYDIGTASSIYIDATGTYDAQAKNSNTFVIKTSNVVSGTLSRKQVWNATESQILLADDRDTNTQLGYGCDIDGDYIIGGGPQDDEGGSAAGAAYIFKKNGTSWTQTAKLMASDPNTNDQFGEFCEISGDYAIVGNYQEDAGGTNAGAAYIYKRDTGAETWTQQAKLMASNAGSSDFFGRGVSIDGDYAIVGAPYEDTGGDGAGAAYIFKRSGASWSQQAIILASDAASADEYGWDVSISGDYAVVGARQEDEGGSNAGAAYIFKYDATYPPDDLPPVDSVGTGFNYKRYTALDTSTHYVYKMWRNSASDWRTPSPASANTIKVLKTDSTDWSDNDTTDTNPEYVDTTTYSGKVSLGQSGPTENYRFSVPTFGRWSQQQKLIGESAGNYFGNAVAIDGDYLAVGAQYEATTATGGGAVYIFKRDGTTWSQQAKLLPSDGQANDELTIEGSLSISGDIVIAGARKSDPGGISNAGAAYVWERSGTTWTETKKFISNKHITTDGRFANSVGVSGDTVVVGAGYEDVDSVTHAGALHVFDKVYVGPTLTYDNANKLSLTGVTTPSSNLTFGSVTTDIGSAKDVYIKDQGTYKFHTNDGNQALLMSNVVSSDPSASYSKTVPLAFHHGTFADSGDPYSDGTVTVAATNGHVYSDTATGTYTWGTLSSVTLTADPGDLEPTSSNSPGTAGKTEYKWTPSSAITNGRTLVVAGGGGGGTDMGGGGGAGGLLASTTTNIAKEEQTITVGGGGTRGLNASTANMFEGGNGGNSSISGPSITSIGGGGGGSAAET